jgi:hypothetical protein
MIWTDILNGIQGIIDWFAEIGHYIINLLPNSPFSLIENIGLDEVMGSKWLEWLNWLLPLKQIIAILQLWVSAIVVYYIYQAILRWVKAIQ